MIHDHSRGVWLMLIGVLIVPWLDGFAKLLGQTLPFLEVAWARFSVQLIVILPLAWFRLGRNMLSLGQWRLQVLRGALLVLASTLFFASLRTMEIADAIAVFFIHPLLTVVIAPILLRENVGLRRWLAALIGFSGALLVIRPGLEHFDWNSLYALATGFCFSGYVLLGRRLAGEGSPLQALVMTGLAQDKQKSDGDLTYNVGDRFWVIPNEDVSLSADQEAFIGKEGEIDEVNHDRTVSMTFSGGSEAELPIQCLSNTPPNSEKPENKGWWTK